MRTIDSSLYSPHTLDSSDYNRTLDRSRFRRERQQWWQWWWRGAFFHSFFSNVPRIPRTGAFTSNWTKERDTLCSSEMDFLSGDIPPLILAPCAPFAFLGIPVWQKIVGWYSWKKKKEERGKKQREKNLMGDR